MNVMLIIGIGMFLIGIVLSILALFGKKLGYSPDFQFVRQELYDGKNLIHDDDGSFQRNYLYDYHGNMVGWRTSTGYTKMISYCCDHARPEYGKPIREKDSDGVEIYYEYNPKGQPIHTYRGASTSPAESWEYDEQGRMVKQIKHEEDTYTVYVYDGDKVKEEKEYHLGSDLLLHNTLYKRDENGNIIEVAGYYDNVLGVLTKHAYNKDCDLIYEYDVINKTETYYIYIIKDEGRGFRTKVTYRCTRKV